MEDFERSAISSLQLDSFCAHMRMRLPFRPPITTLIASLVADANAGNAGALWAIAKSLELSRTRDDFPLCDFLEVSDSIGSPNWRPFAEQAKEGGSREAIAELGEQDLLYHCSGGLSKFEPEDFVAALTAGMKWPKKAYEERFFETQLDYLRAREKFQSPEILFALSQLLPKSHAEKYALQKSAADKDFPPALHAMAVSEPENARQWYERAAKKGFVQSQVALGKSYLETGEFEAAVHWFEEAAKQWHPGALREIAACILQGREGVPKNPPRAAELFTRAGLAGDQNAFLDATQICASGEAGPAWDLCIACMLVVLPRHRDFGTDEKFDRKRRDVLLESLFSRIGNVLSVAYATKDVLTELRDFGSQDRVKGDPFVAPRTVSKESYRIRFGPAVGDLAAIFAVFRDQS